jgi:hypothetical protein
MPDDPGVPLQHYRDEHPGTGVRFYCGACAASHDVAIGLVIERLTARGLGDATTGIRAVAALSDHPCRRCGKVRWQTAPAFRLA